VTSGRVGGLEIRQLGPADGTEAELDLRRRAFGPVGPAYWPRWLATTQGSINDGRMTGVFDDGRLVATARYDPHRQWWRGRSVPMAAVVGVKVAPEYRGRGIGTAMMAELLAQMAAAGYPVSVLFPTTAPLYRSAGWEFAGGKYEVVLPAGSLSALVPSAPGAAAAGPAAAPALRRATAADGLEVVQVKGRVHETLRHCGPNTRAPDAPEVPSFLGDQDQFSYLADDGFLSYRWTHGTAELEVEELIAASAATARAFWQILASHATMAERVRACLAPADPVSWLTVEPAAAMRRREQWMLRVVDAPAAIAGRGYPVPASLRVPLELTDAALPANSGRWTLEVAGGEGRLLRPGESADPGTSAIRLDARGLAALYAGVPLGTLRLAGLVAGGNPSTDDALDYAFAADAFMIDFF
jgi:predicted acetyltransferase